MLSLFISFFIVIIFVTSIALDDLTISKFFFEIEKKNYKSQAFTERGKRFFILRCLNLSVPVICGYFITYYNNFNLIIIICFNLSFLISFINLNFREKLKYYGFKIYFTKLYFVGFVTFIFYLNSPLIINYLSIIFEEYSKIILQLTAILNFFPVLFVTFYMDPLIAKKIDESDDLDYLKGIYISIRLMSRLFIALFFNLLFIYNNFA